MIGERLDSRPFMLPCSTRPDVLFMTGQPSARRPDGQRAPSQRSEIHLSQSPEPSFVASRQSGDEAAGPQTRLVLICGLPASGKSTLARQLAAKIPAVRLDKDEWVTQLGGDVWDDAFRVRIERQLWALTLDLLAQGQSVILEWGHWARVERDEKRLGARSLGVGVELHFLDAPLEELIERADHRTASGEWTAEPMTRAHFEEWSTIFQPPDEEEFLLFDAPVEG